jgi:hypothetical protein
VDQQATRRPPFQPSATIYQGRLKGSQGVTPFLKVTALTGFSYREAGFGGCQGSAVLKGQDPVRGVQLAAWEYGGKGPGFVNFVVALDGVMHNLAARNSQFEDGDGKIRSTYETEFGVYKISVVFLLAGLKGSGVLAGDGSIRIENTSKTGDASVSLISAEEGC